MVVVVVVVVGSYGPLNEQTWLPFDNEWASFLKCFFFGEKKGPRDHLGSVSEFHPETSNPVAPKPNVNIYKALSIL